MKKHIVEFGSFDTIILDKSFGPTIGMNLKIYCNTETAMYEIYRASGKNAEYIRWIDIPMQLESDFDTDMME